MATTAMASSRSSIDQKLLNGPKEPTDENLLYPQISRLDLRPEDGAHTVLPLLGVPVVGFATQRRASSPAAAAATVEHGGHDESGPPNNPRAMRNYVGSSAKKAEGCVPESRQMTRIVDITTESKPGAIAGWTVPDTEELCNRGGRFGPHSANENFTPIYHNRVMFVCALRRRRACRRYSRSVQSEGNRVFHSGSDQQYQQAVHR